MQGSKATREYDLCRGCSRLSFVLATGRKTWRIPDLREHLPARRAWPFSLAVSGTPQTPLAHVYEPWNRIIAGLGLVERHSLLTVLDVLTREQLQDDLFPRCASSRTGLPSRDGHPDLTVSRVSPSLICYFWFTSSMRSRDQCSYLAPRSAELPIRKRKAKC